MRILLLYDNFVRDYRGLLLLAEFLRSMGNKVWIKAGWDDPFSFCRIHHIDTIVTGQVAESATHGYGKYCVDNNLRLVINSSEPILQEKNFSMAIVYNTHELNQDIIDMQTVGVHSLYEYILSHKEIKNSNKSKYKMLGFPRTDISYNKELRELEREKIILKYNLGKYRKKYIFLSSFLLDGAFDGVPEKDLERWNFKEFQIRTVELLSHTAAILKKFIAEYMGENDVLLIKKHPWDCSSFFAENFVSDNCIILDNTEYIIPSLSVADMVIHTHSTSAVEAWIMKKPTVAIFLEKYYDAMCVHMQYERIAHNYEDFITMLNDVDYKVTDVNAPDLFAGLSDGKATYRLAEEINKLRPKRKYAVSLSLAIAKKQFFSLRMYNSLDSGRVLHDADKLAEKNTKYHDFLVWENQRHVVNKLYKKEIKKFVKAFLSNGTHDAS